MYRLRIPVLLLLGMLCAAVHAGDAGVLLVGNKSAHTLWALDLRSGEQRAVFDTGRGPHEVVVSPDARLAVVSNYGEARDGHTLTVVDWPAARVLRHIELGAGTAPHGLSFLADGRLLVTAEGSDQLLLVDVHAGQVLQRIAVGEGTAHMVAASPDARHAWVSDMASGSVAKIDLAAGKLLQRVATGAGAEGVALTPDGGEVWVSNRAEDSVTVIDAGTGAVLATLRSAGFPIRITMSPDGRHALVSNARAATLSVFEVASRGLIATVELAQPGVEYKNTLLGRAALPIGVRVHPDGSRAYVAISGGDEIAVLETAGWQVVARWPTGREPDALGIILPSARP
jgi:YVTN family beta-propeller protein